MTRHKIRQVNHHHSNICYIFVVSWFSWVAASCLYTPHNLCWFWLFYCIIWFLGTLWYITFSYSMENRLLDFFTFILVHKCTKLNYLFLPTELNKKNWNREIYRKNLILAKLNKTFNGNSIRSLEIQKFRPTDEIFFEMHSMYQK